jgi:hypothetical protein
MFLKRQLTYSSEYLPINRKYNLNKDYLFVNIFSGDEVVLNGGYIYSDYEKTILKIGFEQYCLFFDKLVVNINNLISIFEKQNNNAVYNQELSQPKRTALPNLFNDLKDMGFFELEKTIHLSEEKKNQLVMLLRQKKTPYIIAMFYYLGLIDNIDSQKLFKTKAERDIKISNILDIDASGRTVRGNISTLVKKPTGDLSKYTSYQFKVEVSEDYKKIVQGG